jgi:hypothetical protein
LQSFSRSFDGLARGTPYHCQIDFVGKSQSSYRARYGKATEGYPFSPSTTYLHDCSTKVSIAQMLETSPEIPPEAKNLRFMTGAGVAAKAHVQSKSQRLLAWTTMLCNKCCRLDTLRLDRRQQAPKLIKGEKICCVFVLHQECLSISVRHEYHLQHTVLIAH